MSTHARTETRIDVTELGFDAPASTTIGILIEETDDGGTFIEATYEEFVWTLEFDEYGTLTEEPMYSAPSFLGPAIKKAAPQLRFA